MLRKAPVYLWTGDGAGKTATALGIALRQVGHGHRVIIVQFLKGRTDIGEYKIAKKLAPLYEIHQFGRPTFIDLRNPTEEDKRLGRQGLAFARQALKKKPHLLILDEVNLAAAANIVDVNDLIDLLDHAPPKTAIYLTGRHAPKALLERADYVTVFTTLKAPKEITATKGIEY
jgi:cob(I)alamin adenosyltransferase